MNEIFWLLNRQNLKNLIYKLETLIILNEITLYENARKESLSHDPLVVFVISNMFRISHCIYPLLYDTLVIVLVLWVI